MKPPLHAALARLRGFAAWDGDSPNPYNDTGHTLQADLTVLLRAVDLLDEAEHTDDVDMMPVFTVRPECLWKHGSKGLVHCLGMALVNEDAPEGRPFQ